MDIFLVSIALTAIKPVKSAKKCIEFFIALKCFNSIARKKAQIASHSFSINWILCLTKVIQMRYVVKKHLIILLKRRAKNRKFVEN